MIADAVALEVSLFWNYGLIVYHTMHQSFWLEIDGHKGHAVIHHYALDRSLQVVCISQLKPLLLYMSSPS